MPRAKRRKREDAGSSTEKADTDSAIAPPLAAPPSAPQQQPTHILFAESLPSECNEMMLAMLFRQVRTMKSFSVVGFEQLEDTSTSFLVANGTSLCSRHGFFSILYLFYH